MIAIWKIVNLLSEADLSISSFDPQVSKRIVVLSSASDNGLFCHVIMNKTEPVFYITLFYRFIQEFYPSYSLKTFHSQEVIISKNIIMGMSLEFSKHARIM